MPKKKTTTNSTDVEAMDVAAAIVDIEVSAPVMDDMPDDATQVPEAEPEAAVDAPAPADSANSDVDREAVATVAAEDAENPDVATAPAPEAAVSEFVPRQSRFKRTDPTELTPENMVGRPVAPVVAPPRKLGRKTGFLARDVGMPQDPNGAMRELRTAFEKNWRNARKNPRKRALFNATLDALIRWRDKYEEHRQAAGDVMTTQQQARMRKMQAFNEKQLVREDAIKRARTKMEQELADLHNRVSQVLMESGEDEDEVDAQTKARVENLLLDTGTVERSVVTGEFDGGPEGATDE